MDDVNIIDVVVKGDVCVVIPLVDHIFLVVDGVRGGVVGVAVKIVLLVATK